MHFRLSTNGTLFTEEILRFCRDNNILFAITGNADMALRRVRKDASPVEHLQRIKQAADKAADLARQIPLVP